MKSITHLSKEEQRHFIQCSCGKYIDSRNLQEVLDHHHWSFAVKTTWTYSIKKGEPVAYVNGQQITLN